MFYSIIITPKESLCGTLPSLFLLMLMFYFVVALSLSPVRTKDSRRDQTAAGKLAAVYTGPSQLDSSRLTVSPETQLVKLPESVLERKAVNHSPVAKKRSREQPIGTHALWNDWLAKNTPSWSESRAEERSRSLEFFQTSWITKYWDVIMGC